MDWGLKSKSVIVTGGGRGIGKAISMELGRAGAHVLLTYTGSSPESIARAEQVAHEVKALGAQCLAVRLDVTDESEIEKTVELCIKEFGGLYGLVNNAGIAVDGLAMRFKSQDWDKVLDTNLKGTFLMSKACLKPMMRAGGASIVNMGSVVGLMGNAGQAAYAASKAGLEGLTKSLAKELGSRQLRVNLIAPGFIETDMTSQMTEEQKTKLLSGLPLGSLGQPQDIAFATLFLLSPHSRYITGQTLSVNGGLYM